MTHGSGRARLAVLVAAALAASLVSACAVATSADPDPTPTVEATPEPVFQPVTVMSSPTPEPEPLELAEVDDALATAVCWYEDPALAQTCLPPGEETLIALQAIALSGDERFIAPLVDMLWLQVGWERWVHEALERVTGERFTTPAEWYAWMQASQPPLPEEYGAWKGRLLSIIDAQFIELIGPPGAGPVGPEALVWAHVGPRDVPPLSAPATVHRLEEQYLASSDVVYGVVVDGEARAYPERIVAWHGVIHDEVNGRGILVWHCLPCGGAAVFEATASDGTARTFRVAGLAHESRRLLFDEETGSLWDSVTGRAVHGPLAESGVSHSLVNSVRTTWGEWGSRYPGTRVLSLETGHVRDYGAGVALQPVTEADGPLFPVTHLDDRLEPRTRVLGVSIGQARRAYDLEAVERAGLVRDTLGGTPIVLVSTGPGRGATVYEAHEVTFERQQGGGDDRELVDDDEVRWFMDDERLLNSRNSHVRRALPSQTLYWFAWSGAYPTTTTWSP